MWNLERVIQEIVQGSIFKKLSQERQTAVMAIPQAELTESISALINRPPVSKIPHGGVLSNLVYAAQYYELFGILELPRQLGVYEPCAGGSDPVIIATEAYDDGQGSYTTINLNRKLRAELQSKIGHLDTSIRIIDDNAQRSLAYLEPNSMDVSCFHHAINDAIQTAVSEPRGMDTSTVDWWPNERQMIEWMAEDFESGAINERGKPELMEIIGKAVEITRPDGYMVFDHWASLGYREADWFPWEMFYDLVPITRRWIKESDLPLTEIELPDADPQWWIFFQVGR